MKNLLLFVSIISFLTACNPQEKTADEIIHQAIQYHGGNAYDTANIAFTFRDKEYALSHNNGEFEYKRMFEDSTGNQIVDILNNEGFSRKINDSTVQLQPKDSAAYANSVNSVHYFALLPYGLDNSAVLNEKLENTTIKEKEYYTVKIGFEPEGGGTDFEDEFVFWFDIEDFSMDYFAYSYQTEGGGIRFREAYNPQQIAGITFQDYNNFKADKNADLKHLPAKFEKGELKLLSTIELKLTDKGK
ncbi:hypothetical protein JKA74_15685 [Marivirga sp. S37H4]|uniref:Deoxyribose-phosphate aldolase n=1 Tax=Marivirga aurantiaca TaxID=2802615 RepID=A0A935CA06_9BACT|nr:DUF6503 family protein [Marivirga aurantiaca]MBK6266486.1 hypothetical protein [Marivirga aurantiaca]